MFGGGWMIVNGSACRVGARAGAVGREDVGRQPALVDRALEVGRPVGLRKLGRRRRSCRSSSVPVNRTTRSSSGRTGSWYHLLVRRRGRSAHRGRLVRCPLGALSGAGRHGSRVTFAPAVPARLAPSRARSVAVEALLLPVLAVRAECSTGPMPPEARTPTVTPGAQQRCRREFRSSVIRPMTGRSPRHESRITGGRSAPRRQEDRMATFMDIHSGFVGRHRRSSSRRRTSATWRSSGTRASTSSGPGSIPSPARCSACRAARVARA